MCAHTYDAYITDCSECSRSAVFAHIHISVRVAVRRALQIPYHSIPTWTPCAFWCCISCQHATCLTTQTPSPSMPTRTQRYVRTWSSYSTSNYGIHFIEIAVDAAPVSSSTASTCTWVCLTTCILTTVRNWRIPHATVGVTRHIHCCWWFMVNLNVPLRTGQSDRINSLSL